MGNLAEDLKNILELQLFIKDYDELEEKTFCAPVRKYADKPVYSQTKMKNISKPVKKEVVSFKRIIWKIIIGIILIGLYLEDPDASTLYIPVVGVIILIASAVFPIYKENERYSQALLQYNKELEVEKQRCQTEDARERQRLDLEYKRKTDEYDAEYKKAYSEYQMNLKCVANLKSTREGAEIKLNDLYDILKIHPKYRNINAISAFYDFISTGRCKVLEGWDGAYNLYEEQLQKDQNDKEIKRLQSVVAQLQQNLQNEQQLRAMAAQHAAFMHSVDNFNLQMSLRESIHELGMHISSYL